MAPISSRSGNEWEKLSPAIPARAPHPDDDLFMSRRDRRRRREAAEQASRRSAASSRQHRKARSSTPTLDYLGDLAEPGPARSSGQAGRQKTSQAQESISASRQTDFEPELPSRAAARRAAAQETKDPTKFGITSLITALAVPCTLLLLAVRMVASSTFLWLEYHRPGFPKDIYGFSTEDRMIYGSYGMDYIRNFAPQEFISGLKTDKNTSLFLAQEVQHLSDVKQVLFWYSFVSFIIFLLGLLCLLLLRSRSAQAARQALFAGAISTGIILVILALLAVLGWESFFTGFHQLLFPQGNWEFKISDTLIRLYPPRFWVDAALALALLTGCLALALAVASWPGRYRSAPQQLLDRPRAGLKSLKPVGRKNRQPEQKTEVSRAARRARQAGTRSSATGPSRSRHSQERPRRSRRQDTRMRRRS